MKAEKSSKVAVYARVSTDDQDCQRQIGDLREMAKRMNFEVTHEFSEKASGRKNSREHREEILKLARQRKIGAVLVTEMSRWGRSLQDLLATLNQLKENGVSVIAANGLTFDLATSHGKLMAGILGSLAEFESDLLSERTKSGIAAARKRGKQIGRKKGMCPKTDSIKDELLNLIDSGVPYVEIAARFGISKTTVVETLKRCRPDHIQRRGPKPKTV